MTVYGIGDIHGNIATYESILNTIYRQDEQAYTLQVGDWGIGTPGVRLPNVGERDFWIAGNHDDARACKACPGNLGDFGCRTLDEGLTLFWVRGALSTDTHNQLDGLKGVTWWPYEELSPEEADEALALYRNCKPDLVLSHDCPGQIRSLHRIPQENGTTASLLRAMFDFHQPGHWVYGHHHRNWEDKLGDTQFWGISDCEYRRII